MDIIIYLTCHHLRSPLLVPWTGTVHTSDFFLVLSSTLMKTLYWWVELLHPLGSKAWSNVICIGSQSVHWSLSLDHSHLESSTLMASNSFWMLFPFLCRDFPVVVRNEMVLAHCGWSQPHPLKEINFIIKYVATVKHMHTHVTLLFVICYHGDFQLKKVRYSSTSSRATYDGCFIHCQHLVST